MPHVAVGRRIRTATPTAHTAHRSGTLCKAPAKPCSLRAAGETVARRTTMPHAAPPAAVAAPTFTYGASPLLLRRAMQHDGVGDLGLARVFRRLHGGHAVRMMAFGTSITAISGGCTHSLLPYCPMCCGTRDYCGKSHERCLASSNNTVGFLRRTLEWMNETWPHAGHRLYNGGRPGAGGLANFLGCLSTWVPEEIDLFWFEVGGTGNNIAMVERLARQLYGFRPPAERPARAATRRTPSPPR